MILVLMGLVIWNKEWINDKKKLLKFNIDLYRGERIKKQQRKLFEREKKLKKEIMREENFKQNSLAPKILQGKELEKIQPYIDRLDESVRMTNVNNVALMSSYGAGKSTILRNFEKAHGEYNFLNLSLGSYSLKEDGKIIDENGNITIVDLNERLENSLVKQMIYREKKSKLPYSRFKKIHNVSKIKVATFFFLQFLAIIGVLFLTDFLSFRLILEDSFSLIKTNSNKFELIFYILFLLGFFYLLFIIASTILRQFSISKLSVGNVAIEGNETSMSYFNKYIDEIFYYFETNKFNIVIIEDVDRFGSIKIFEHLKELNILLNNSKQIKRNITFIYAVKEDIFSRIETEMKEHESELRTKFFELIIPVIPVIDTFNSRDYLIPMMKIKEREIEGERLKKETELSKGTKEEPLKKSNTIDRKSFNIKTEFEIFLSDISLHIQDLRLLNNIVNEYYTFIDVHGNISESFDKKRLFSLISLKNLNPSVYIQLQKSEGELFKALATNEHDNELILETRDELKLLEEELEELEANVKIDKFMEAQIFFFQNRLSFDDKILFNGSHVKLSDFKKEMIEELLKDNGKKIEFYSRSIGQGTLDKKELESRVKDDDGTLRKKIDDKFTEIKNLKIKISSFQRLSLQNKINHYPSIIDKLFLSSEELVKNGSKAQNHNRISMTKREKDFLLFLISNGYLAEDYSSYLSVFYEGTSLTSNDKNLLVKLKSNQVIGFEEDVFDASILVENLSVKDFERQGILNINILLFLFSEKYEDAYNIRGVVLEKWFTQNENTYADQLEVVLLSSNISKLIFKMVELFGIEFFRKSNSSMKSLLVNWILSSSINEEKYFKKIKGESLFDILIEGFLKPKMEYTIAGVQHTEESEPEYLIKNNILSRPNFFNEIDEYVDRIELIESLGKFNSDTKNNNVAKILFENISLKDFGHDEYQKFIELELFDYNPEMLSNIINYGDFNEVKEVSYENILSLENKSLIEHVQKNLDCFIRNVLVRLDTLSETEGSIIKMFDLYEENPSMDFVYQDLIRVMNIKISDLKVVKNENLWNSIIEHKKYNLSWLNIMQFKQSEKANLEYLKGIFNDTQSLLELKENHYEITDASKKQIELFLKSLVDNKIIDVNKNNLVLLEITKYDAFNLDKEIVELLLTKNLVEFDIDTINEFRALELKAELLLNYQDDYINNISVINLTVEEITKLVKRWNKSDISRLIELLFNKESTDLFQSKEFIDILLSQKVIVTDEQMNKLISLNPEVEFIQEYFLFNLSKGTLEENTIKNVLEVIYQTTISSLTVENINVIFNSKIDSKLFVKIFNYTFKIRHYSEKDYKQIADWLGKQDKPFSDIYIDGRVREISVDKTNDNEELLKNLKIVGIISSFKDKGENLFSVYPKRNEPFVQVSK